MPSLCPHLTIHQEKSGEERSDAGSQAAESDYDVEEEYDNDYAENYFDNGEGDDLDDLGGGGGGDDGGGGEMLYFFFRCPLNAFRQITTSLLSEFKCNGRKSHHSLLYLVTTGQSVNTVTSVTYTTCVRLRRCGLRP